MTRNKNARDAIQTYDPLTEWILRPSELAGLSYPRPDTKIASWHGITGESACKAILTF